MRKTYKYRIYPSKAQATALTKQLEASRLVYNRTLAVRKSSYENLGISLGLYDTQKMLTAWKSESPALKVAHSQVLQNVQVRVDLAFQAFFRRVKEARLARARGEDPEEVGYPRFKGVGRYDSLCYPQYGNGARLDGNRLVLSKVGSVKVKLHREMQGTPKTVCVRRGAGDKWHVTLSCAPSGHPAHDPLPSSPKVVGIDVGTQTFGTLSNGEKIANPRFFTRAQKTLATAQRRKEKCPLGSPERRKRAKIENRIHTRIANRRADFAHKLSRKLVNEYGVIALEDLNIIGMMAEHTVIFGNKLNRSIADVAWHQFAQFVVYKAAEAGRQCVQVDPRNTSKMCSRCRLLVPKAVSVRIHNCPHCGLIIDRDHNAAINILALGLQSVSADLSDEAVEAPAERLRD